MKGFGSLLLLISTSLSAAFCQTEEAISVLRKKVSIVATYESREHILKNLQKNYSIHFFYQSNLQNLDYPLSLTIKDMYLEDALKELFTGSGIHFKEIEGQIVLNAEIVPKAITRDQVNDTRNSIDSLIINNSQNDHLQSTVRKPKPTRRFFCPLCFLRSSDKREKDSFLKTDSLEKDTILKRQSYNKRIKPRLIHKPKEFLSLTFFVCPAYTFRSLNKTSTQGKSILTNRNASERGTLRFNEGIFLTVPLFNNRMNIGTGLTYLQTSEQGQYTPQNTTNIQYQTINYQNSFSFLTIPMTVGKSFNRKNWGIAIQSGIAVGFLASHKTTFNYYNYFYSPSQNTSSSANYNGYYYPTTFRNNNDFDQWKYYSRTSSMQTISAYPGKPQTTTYKKLLWIYTLRVSAQFKIHKNIFFYSAPTLQYFLSSIYPSSAPIKEKPWAIGLETGLRIQLKN